ncbi:MAG: GTP-binding protein [archaeon]|nr:GTP-binding protein [archaeon]
MKTPLIILAGYLGSGKTTLLKHIIRNTDKKIAVLMNEFGEIGIDTDTIQGENITVKELLEGCVCCSLQGEFEAGVKEIITNYSPDMIILETTGIAEADNLVLDIENDLIDISLEAVITIVDADIFVRFPTIGGNTWIQIESANILLLNKIDLVSEKQVEEIIMVLKKINPKAPIIQTINCVVDLDVLLSVEVGHKHTISTQKKDHEMETFTIEVSGNTTEEKLDYFLSKLPSEIFRLKGYLNVSGKNNLLNYVGGRWLIEQGQGRNYLVFIGEGILKKKEEISVKVEDLML